VELENGAIKEGGVTNSTPIGLNIFKKDAVDKFVGLKVGDSVDLNLFKSAERDRASILKFVLDIKNEADVPENMGETFRLTISKVGKMQKCEMDDAFFAKIYGEGVITSEAQLKDKLTEEVNEYFSKETEAKLKNEIIQYLLDNVEMAFPEKFLKRWIKVTNENPITDEQVEADFDNFIKGLRWTLITNKISKDNDIKAEKEDIEALSKEQLRKQLAVYNPGGNDISDEQLQMFNASMMANEEHVKKTYEAVMEQKLFGFLKNEVTIAKKEVTLEEFKDLNKQN
jgi:trigger factor